MRKARRTLRVLYRLTTLNMGLALAYRGEFAMFMIASLATPVISLLIWRAALASGVRLPVDADYVTTYFILLGIVSMLTSSWIAPYIADEIRDGRLSVWLVRPAPSQLHGISNNLTEKVLKFCWHLPVVVLLWWIFRDSMELPGDVLRWAVFAVSVVLAGVLVFTLDVLIGSLAFWFDDVGGIYRAYGLFSQVFSGAVVPLALMPDWSRGVLDVQPFRFMLSFPLEIVIGGLNWAEIGVGLTMQAGYVGVVLLGTAAVWRNGIRSYSAVGA